ncbi:TetR/AcrR family transcriptional regulator [Sphingobacterium siyangense]|uniref:TetR family transcriptional regulator n=1 Tax=Sphingobacterium siyangense TaxID=459529 RepID=A0A562MKH6_9SPHI|nr:TetR/AcrR family transcriptional regulator [Sphingobacterium siyangense]TWI20338.1 TetR family transcriptional regulator [Sphingobacterium siyangense]
MPRNKEFDYSQKLQKVRDLFWKKGYHTTSLRDIVNTMQLNKSSIYDSFGNKHTLFIESLKDYSDLKEQQYRKALKNGTSPIIILEKTIRDVVEQAIIDKKTCLIVKTIFEVAETDKEVQMLLVKITSTLQSILADLVKSSQEEGAIKMTTDPKIVARFIFSGFSSLWSHYIISENKKEVNEMVDLLIEMIKK